jgi:hypothetical protein
MTAWARFASPGRAARPVSGGRPGNAANWLMVTSKPDQGSRSTGPARPRDQRERRAKITRKLQLRCERSHRYRGSGGITLRMTAATALGLGFFARFRRDAIIGAIGFTGGNRASTAAVRAQARNVVLRR